MYSKNISEEIKSVFRLLQENTKECALKNIFQDLPGYDREASYHPFLSELVLCDLELPAQPLDNSIVFKSGIKELPGFLKEAACYEEIAGIRTLECSITQDAYGEIIFAGIYRDLSGISMRIAEFDLEVERLLFYSGTTQQTRFTPGFEYCCFLGSGSTKTGLTVNQVLEEGIYFIHGEFTSAGDLTLDQIFSLFHITDIQIGDGLPEGFGTAVFDCLRLKEVSIEASGGLIHTFTAKAASGHPLALAADKIRFTPNLYISVNNSMSRGVWNVYAYGEFCIGGSFYEIYVNPCLGEIRFGLKEGSILDLAAVSKLFFDIELPALQFDRLSASMGLDSGRYVCELGAVDILEFGVAEKRIAIEGVLLQVIYEQGQFAVAFTGSFDVCHVAFQVSGIWYGGGHYGFSCCITRNIDIHLSDLFHDFFGHSCLLSDGFDFTIATLGFCCDLQQASSFRFSVSAEFCGSDETLKKLFALRTDADVTAVKEDAGWKYAIDIGCGVEIGESQMLECRYRYDSASLEHENIISLLWKPETPEDSMTFKDILNAVGLTEIDDSWSFLTQIGICYAKIDYDFGKKRFTGEARILSGGSVNIWIDFGEKRGYGIVVSLGSVISFAGLPIAGGLVDRFQVKKEDFGVRDMTVYALTSPDEQRKIPAGVRMDLTVFGSGQQWQIYEAGKESRRLSAVKNSGSKASSRVFWIKVERSMAIFTLHRIGLGLDGPYITFLLDASLNVAPLRFDLFGAGIGVSLSDFAMKFYLSGFGISYTSPALAIGGALMRCEDTYSGQLIVQTKPFSLTAVAEYRTDGHLFAYAVVAADLGGPPAFYIKGIALGFGYNKRLVLPGIDGVADYPLVKAASGRMSLQGMLADLDAYIEDENGQRFLAFGLKFDTFGIAESFVLLTVNFGNHLEAALLGISDITMPPNCGRDVQPIAHAQLSLKAQIKPEEGFFGIEARLTNESYILSRDCHLTGGFAFFMWFGGEHAGDFVITLGGYHPKYACRKPAHYPDVPRVGFQWNIGEHVNVTGEAYFALTPGAVMAGGRLSMTYTLGNLKAYFIAKADFLICWKPFHYDIEIGITLGVSYHLKLGFISKTITLELGTDLHIWGPDFSAVAYVSIWILSFTIKIGADASQSVDDLDWQECCSSFLPKEDGKNGSGAAPLKIVFGNGLSGEIPAKKVKKDGAVKKEETNGEEEKISVVSPGGVTISMETAVPITTASLNGGKVPFEPADVSVKPMGKGGSGFRADFSVEVKDEAGGDAAFDAFVIRRNMPCALWGGEGELKKDVPCGIRIVSREPEIVLFPKKNDISLDDLYEKGTEKIEHAFAYRRPESFPDYTDKDTVVLFSRTVDSDAVKERRRQFLKGLGVELTEDISLKKYAAGADNYLDEEVLVPVYG